MNHGTVLGRIMGVAARSVFGFVLLFPVLMFAQSVPVAPNTVYQRPVIVPVPAFVAGTSQGVLSISRPWFTLAAPADDFYTNSSTEGWTEQQGGRGMRGGGGGSSRAAYRKVVQIPADYSGKRTILRFDGVAHAAKLWVNGTFVRSHWGSNMAWTCDITPFVKPGAEARIDLLVDESPDGLAAFVRGGGIQRDVFLFAVPANYVERFHVETKFDDQYKNATLQVLLHMAIHQGKSVTVQMVLKDAEGRIVPLSPSTVTVQANKNDVRIPVRVEAPRHWDAEHPYLYTLEVKVLEGSAVVQTVRKNVGFREVERRGNQLFVNGMEVKFRGLWGGNSARSMLEMNVNHTRQKWVTEALLDSCDRLGVYVLDENPVDFAKYGAESLPEYAYQWLSFVSELMERDFSHPCVVMWGLGNESFHGDNVLQTHKYAESEDKQRPTMFSWSHRIGVNDPIPYTVYSYHYPNNFLLNPDFSDFGVSSWNSPSLIQQRAVKPLLPVLADEFCHLTLSAEELNRDVNVRNFWGESIKLFWERMFTTKGSLGGDIFGLRGNDLNNSSPEAYMIRKAYSPVRLSEDPLPNPGPGKQIGVPVKNWFDHTNLNEISFQWQIGSDKGTIKGPDVAPHAAGSLVLPSREWRDGEVVHLKVFSPDNRLIDEFALTVNPGPESMPTLEGPGPQIVETPTLITVKGANFEIVFDRYKGQIIKGTYGGELMITGGPYLQLLRSGLSLSEWWCQPIQVTTEGIEAVIRMSGRYAVIGVDYEIRIDGKGLITMGYQITDLKDPAPVPRNQPWDGTDVGGYSEVGLFLELSGKVSSLSWNRKSLWSVYPETHIGRPVGTTQRLASAYTDRSWAHSSGDVQFYGGTTPASPVTNDFKSSKEYIYQATAWVGDSGKGLQAVSQATDAVRMEPTGTQPDSPVRMYINNMWNYPTLGLGNYMKPPIMIQKGYRNVIRVRFVTIGI